MSDKEIPDDSAELDALVQEILGEEDESTDADGETESKDGEEKTPDGEPEAEEKDEKEETPPPTLDLNDPTVQETIRTAAQRLLDEQNAVATRQRSAEEIDRLVKEGDAEELGRRFISEYTKGKTNSETTREVLTNFLGQYYEQVFRLPEFQDLTAEEQQALDPRKFPDDITYVMALNTFVADKRSNKTVAQKAEELAEERLKAIQNGEVPNRVATAAGANLPGASAPSSPGSKDYRQTSGRELLVEGLKEIIDQAS